MHDKEKLLRFKQAAIDKDLAAIESIYGELMLDAVGRQEKEYLQLLVGPALNGQIDRLQDLITAATEVPYEHTVEGQIEKARERGREDIVANIREHARIIEDIRQRTGVEYRNVQGIPTDDECVSRAVLPILAEWLEAGCRPDVRAEIFMCFQNGHAKPYFTLLLKRLEKEEAPGYGVETLLQLLARLAEDSDVPKVWEAIRLKSTSPEWYAAATNLSNRKTAPAEIAIELRRQLDEGGLPIGAVQLIAGSRSPRIRDWFSRQLDSKDPNVARLARRVAAKKPLPPPGVLYPAPEPDQGTEVDSCEIDIKELSWVLNEYRGRWGLKLPRWLQSRRKLEFLDLDEAASVSVRSKNGGTYNLSIRLEDYDTVGLRLSRE